MKTVDRIAPDAWAVITPNDTTQPRALVFFQGDRAVEVELSDTMAAAFGIPARPVAAQDDEPVIDPDCRDGKHSSCVGGPCQCQCHEDEPKAGAR